MIIREIEKKDETKLCDFLTKLSQKTLHNWNRFGTEIGKKVAEKISKEQVRKSKKKEKGFIAVGKGGEITGYGFLRYFPEKNQKRFNISLGIVVADNFQGKGVGRALMNYLIKHSIKEKIKKIWLSVYADNKGAIKFYNSFGFEIEGIFMHDEYFDKNPRHVVSMSKFLDKNIKNPSLLRKKLIENLKLL